MSRSSISLRGALIAPPFSLITIASVAMAANPEIVSPDPVPYDARYESAADGELLAPRPVRDAAVGILRGEMRIASDLPPNLAQGLFAHGGTYPLVMRFSPRGLAVKVIGVPGSRLPGSEDDVTQDFVMINRGRAEAHMLSETYFSMTPFLYGRYMARFSIAPASTELRALRKPPLNVREATVAFFRKHGADWELRVQLCVDIDQMPIDDTRVAWPESLCAWLPIARIVVPAQLAWSEARAKAIDASFSFSPWHGLAAHRPLGSTERARREPSSIPEPRDLSQLPD